MPLIIIEKAMNTILQSAGLPDYYSVHGLRHPKIQTAPLYVGIKEREEQETVNRIV